MTQANSWSRGYPVDESYPASWHYFQSPAWLRAICAVSGVAWEVDASTPLSICEVGCGIGYTANLLAAAQPQSQVVGLDYNPAHIAEARSLARAAGLGNTQFLEVDLADLDDASLAALPEFDLIMAHGVWSWVGDPVRKGVLRLIQRRLKPGGLVLMTYNCLPGAAGSLGLARLVRPFLASDPDSTRALGRAGDLVRRIFAAEPSHLGRSGWSRLLTGEQTGARSGYLRHEFQTEHWRPEFFADVAEAMQSVRCDYVGSATIDENFPAMSLTPAQLAIWEEVGDPATRELIFDLCVQRAFRRDVYVRGLRRIDRVAATRALQIASVDRSDAPLVLHTQAGEAKLPEEMIRQIRSRLAQGPQTIGDLRSLPGCGSATPEELAAMLLGSRTAEPVWRDPDSAGDEAEAQRRVRRFHQASAARLAPYGVGHGSLGLGAPLLGGVISASALELAIVGALADLAAEPDVAGADDADLAGRIAQRLLPPGPPPDSATLGGLMQAIQDTLRDRAPIWRSLGIL